MRTRNCGLLALAIVAAMGCTPAAEQPAGPWSAWVPEPNAYAGRFRIWHRGDDRWIVVFGPGGEQDTLGCYWLSVDHSGALPPANALRLPAGLDRIALTSTTYVPYVSALGRVGTVVACTHIDQVRDPALLERSAAGFVQEIGTGDGLDRELLVAIRPQALLTYPFGRSGTGVIERSGIPVIEVGEYLEEHPLGRAEWLRFFGALLGREQLADSLFRGIRERYEALRADSTLAERPSVLFGSVWNGQWWVPPGNSYMARLIADAGGRYLFADRRAEGNIAVDMETMIATASEADLWGMIADIDHEPSVRDFTGGDQRLAAFKAVRSGHLFLGNTANEDLFGKALIEPDIMLEALREFVHPHLVVDHPGGYRPKYFAGMYREVVPPRIRTEQLTIPQ